LAKKTFRFSITYLSLLFAALLIDHYYLWDESKFIPY
jgi:protoheme IX farnesyltransferase